VTTRPARSSVVGIDGPDGVGKTAVARELAAGLRRRWLSVGMLYRALAATGASPDAVIDVTSHAADDAHVDPIVHIDSRSFVESELTGEELGRRAAELSGQRRWQERVNPVIRSYVDTDGLVVEGRATSDIFAGDLTSFYLWASDTERQRRSAATTNNIFGTERQRRDTDRLLEPLRVRPGCVAWNSTRHPLAQTVNHLKRRVDLLEGRRQTVVAVNGPDDVSRMPALDGLVIASVTELDNTEADALIVLPSTASATEWANSVRAHVTILLASNDSVSIGPTRSASQPDLESTPWPLQRRLTTKWLMEHGHFAVGADLLDTSGTLATSALAGARWIPNPWADLSGPIAPVHGDVDAASLLDALQSEGVRPDSAPTATDVDLRGCGDPRLPVWILAAAPDRDLRVRLPWPTQKGGPS
jgi:cytidylate kinase